MFQELYFLIVTGVSVLLVLMIMPSVIHIAQKNQLFDDHSLTRKDHGYGIPRLGGVAFFASIILTSLFIVKSGTDLPMYQLYAASLILFGLGIKDDLSGVHFHTKLIVQAVVAFIITVSADIRINSFYGVFNINQLDYV
ncbi:MAG: undecaprenyl/decaprenyl-phosphate alpha-N-acetylglucosaminyl 1-phosphate transferase, partial [Sphingobacteriaceae bacterium]